MRARSAVTIVALSALLVVGACGDDRDDDPGVSNPAAVYCEQRGGRVSGPEPMCELPDGSIVDAWEFYRAESGEGSATELCDDLEDPPPGPESICELADGSIVDASDYFRDAGQGD